MAKILQSPIILPPESISKNTITRQAFSLGRAFAVTFQISSNNLKLIATESTDENGEIITEYTSEPDTDKELGFSIFLTDDTDAHTFGASAGRCGWIDYSTKGEVAEGINDNGNKVIIDFEDNSTKSDLDLLLDHVYPENINNLVKNQTPGLKSIFGMLFLSNKTFFNSVTDAYGNLYYDSLIVDTDGNVTDFLTGELKPISEYQAPVIIQYSIGENIHYMVYDFIFEDKPIDILNINYYTFRLLFENHGGILTLEIMKPGETFYRPCMTKELPYNYYGNHNIRFGFGQFTPLFSYDIDKKANFNIHNIQLQQSDERPDWLKTLDKELKNLLGNIPFNTELLGAENKLVIHTDRLDDTMLATIDELLTRVLPQNIELVQYNHHIELTYDEYMKYSLFTSKSQLQAVYPDYKDDVTVSGVWAYNLENLKGDISKFFQNSNKIKKLYVSFPSSISNTYYSVSGCSVLEELDISFNDTPKLWAVGYDCPVLEKAFIHAPNATEIDGIFSFTPKLKDWKLTVDWENLKTFIGSLRIPAITSWDIPLPKCSNMAWNSFTEYLTSFEVELPSLQLGYRLFINCCLDKPSVLRICNSIPSVVFDESDPYGKGRLGLGIHIDHQTDEEVQAAIANAEAKGWVLTVQWKGTPTSAASVMRFGQIIYAKVVAGRDGKPVLDWGHYVTNEEDYETFRSLESAYEYFGLKQEEIALN